MVSDNKEISQKIEIAITYSKYFRRTFHEVNQFYSKFATDSDPDRFLKIIFWLGKKAINVIADNQKRTIIFSPVLRERLGHHIHGEIWANNIKFLLEKKTIYPIHIISANMHSVMNSLYAKKALVNTKIDFNEYEGYETLSKVENQNLRNKVRNMRCRME